MDKIDNLMHNFIAECGYEPAMQMFSQIKSGKKLRSKLLLKIAGESEISLKLCAIVELIHAASLLHDDVIDESDTRRGNPSINAVFGSKNAVMLGDIFYSKAFFELCSFNDFISKTISNAVFKLSIGELMDVKMSQNFNKNRENYLTMIYYKTAGLIESVAKSGAFLANSDCEKFAEYGKNLGLAFQIIDDILDITQDSKKLGKPALNDFKEGKTTLPYIYLYEKLPLNEREILQSYFKKELNCEQSAWIKDKFQEFKIIEFCINEAKNFGKKAVEAVEEFNNKELIKIAGNMINREF